MPIAAYTLDDIFDPDSIKHVDPRSLIPPSQAEALTTEKTEKPTTPPPKRNRVSASLQVSDHKRKRESTPPNDSGVYLDPPKERRCAFVVPPSPSSKPRTKGSKLSGKENRTIDFNLKAKKPSRARSKSLWRPPADSRLVPEEKPRKASFQIFPDPDAPSWRDDTGVQPSQSISKISDGPERKTNQSIFPEYRTTAPAAARPIELTPHTLYWNDLIAQGKLYSAGQRDNKEGEWTLDISDLLHAPTVQSTIFEVGKEYRGKQFDGYVH